jgi:hypothetical protein
MVATMDGTFSLEVFYEPFSAGIYRQNLNRVEFKMKIVIFLHFGAIKSSNWWYIVVCLFWTIFCPQLQVKKFAPQFSIQNEDE